MIKILRTSAGKILRTPTLVLDFSKLYNWYAATDVRNISSSNDWIVPTITNFQDLITYLGGNSVAGHKLREVNAAYWNNIVYNTNETGFNARGGGYRNLATGVFSNIKDKGVYLTTTVPYTVYVGVLYLPDSGSATIEYGVGTVGHKKTGASIRLLYTGSGSPTSYTGNDGKVYPVVTIGTQTYTALNLAETKYRNGDLIPEVTDNTDWINLITGACCNYDNNEMYIGTWKNIKSILRRLLEDVSNYGLLYNEYTIEDSRKLTSSDDWSVFSAAQYNAMCVAIGGYSVAGGKLKETGTAWWNSPNTGATDEYNFHARGTGYRLSTGEFSTLKSNCFIWTTSPYSGGSNISASLTSASASSSAGSGSSYKTGLSIRLVKDATGVPDGSRTFYTGNDGRVYSAIAINGLYWLQQALAETRFRTGDIIPWYGADAANFFTASEWAALTTAGCAAFNNDVANVGTGFSFPT